MGLIVRDDSIERKMKTLLPCDYGFSSSATPSSFVNVCREALPFGIHHVPQSLTLGVLVQPVVKIQTMFNKILPSCVYIYAIQVSLSGHSVIEDVPTDV